ncbi:MBL fold metallo-hydrolase [Gemmatimonadota bacterium]
MRFWVLGAGTLLPDPVRGSPAHCLQTEKSVILLDCGTGAVRTMARLGLPWQGVTHLLISHFHTDHIADLSPFLFALKHGLSSRRKRPLSILGPRGLRNHLEALARAFGDFVLNPGFPVVVEELGEGAKWKDAGTGLALATYPARHSEGALAYRLEAEKCVVGYTGDTGPDPALGRFLTGCGLLVAECSHGDERPMETHLTPSSLADLAREACPDLLLTVHTYPPLDPVALPDLLRDRGYSGTVVPAQDGLWVELRDGVEPRVGRGVDLPASGR